MLATASLLAGCADSVDSELEVRGCLFPSTVVRHAATLPGREVAVCGSVWPHKEVLWLSDGERPHRAIGVHFPTRTEDAGILRTLERLKAREEKGDKVYAYGRFHGRIVYLRGYAPTLQVERVDWLNGFDTD